MLPRLAAKNRWQIRDVCSHQSIINNYFYKEKNMKLLTRLREEFSTHTATENQNNAEKDTQHSYQRVNNGMPFLPSNRRVKSENLN